MSLSVIGRGKKKVQVFETRNDALPVVGTTGWKPNKEKTKCATDFPERRATRSCWTFQCTNVREREGEVVGATLGATVVAAQPSNTSSRGCNHCFAFSSLGFTFLLAGDLKSCEPSLMMTLNLHIERIQTRKKPTWIMDF